MAPKGEECDECQVDTNEPSLLGHSVYKSRVRLLSLFRKTTDTLSITIPLKKKKSDSLNSS